VLSKIAEIIRDLLIFIVVIAALLITLVEVVSNMPDTNPLKRILIALSYRLLATLAARARSYPVGSPSRASTCSMTLVFRSS
jgi:hypothetical protein